MRGNRPGGVLGCAALAALLACACATAFAYYTASGTGNASASVANLAAPSISSAAASSGGKVALSWSPISPLGPGAIGYAVYRDGEAAAGNCPGSAPLSQVTSCSDEKVAVGVHTYTVRARWRSWTASSASVEVMVNIGEATHLALSAVTTTPTAGTNDNLTIVATDESGNTVPTYTGAHNLTFSGAATSPEGTAPTVTNSSGSAKAFGVATAISFTAGAASVSGSKNGAMKLYSAEATSISVSDGSISSALGLEVKVAAAALSKLVLGVESTSPVAGEVDNLTTTAADTYGNPVPTYSGSHKLTFTGGSVSPNGTTPGVTDSSGATTGFGVAAAIDFNAGVAAVSGGRNGAMRLYKSGSTSLKVSDGSLTSAVTVATVAPASASELSLAASSTTPAPAAADNLTTTALDGYGNVDTGYAGLHSLTFAGASASPDGSAPTVADSVGALTEFGVATAINFNAGVAKVAASKNGRMKLYAAEVATVTVSDGAIADKTGVAITVSPAAAKKLALTHLTASAGTIGDPCLFTCTVAGLGNNGTIKANVAVTDTYGNTVSGLGKGHAVKVSSSGGTLSGSTLAIPTAGAAESATQFAYTSKSSGAFADTITAASSEGTTYAGATATASR